MSTIGKQTATSVYEAGAKIFVITLDMLLGSGNAVVQLNGRRRLQTESDVAFE